MKGTIGTTRHKEEDLGEMPFFGHLDELRKVLVQSAYAFCGLMMISWFFSGQILDFITKPLPVQSLYFLNPTEAFMVRVRISLVAGIMLAFPFILYRVWAFVSPGLFARERKKILPFLVASSALFYTGVLFCFFILVPIVLKFFLDYGTARLNPLISVDSYFSFVARLTFAFGIVFQLPVIVLVLSLLGIVKPRWLLRQWRYGILGIFVASAILTPPDAISMMAMALPVLVLYAASVIIAFVAVGRKSSDE
jgi:sec-independent protein translocase protein TatC